MNTKAITKNTGHIIYILALLILFSSCSTQKNIWGDPEDGIILQYRMDTENPFTYEQVSEHKQIFSIRGQEMIMDIDDNIVFQAQASKTKKPETPLLVTIDSMYMHINHANGEIIPDFSEIQGKSFNMTLTNHGKEGNMEEASEIWYTVASGEKDNLATKFSSLFPNLPENPVKAGNQWTTYDTIHIKDENKDALLIFENIYTFNGFETYKGYECVKASSIVIGTIFSQARAEGMDLITNMDITGTGTLYFAYKDGLLIEESINSKSVGELVAPEATIPITRDIIIRTTLIK